MKQISNAMNEMVAEWHQIFITEVQEKAAIHARKQLVEKRKAALFAEVHKQSAAEHRAYVRNLWDKIKEKFNG